MSAKALEFVQRYLAGELDLESAAQRIHDDGEFGMYYTDTETTPAQRELLNELMGRVLWLAARETPEGAPDKPFGAEDIRAMIDGTFFDEPGDNIEFILADASLHRDQLIDLNVEYLSWVFNGIEEHLGIPADEVVGKPAREYVPDTIEKVCGDAPPKGVFYLLQADGQLAGMGGLRFLDTGVAEIKRIYVRPQFRGRKLGQFMLARVMSDAMAFGYKTLCLDSGPFMKSAQRMYESAGFKDCAAYQGTEVPVEFRDRWRFMKRDL